MKIMSKEYEKITKIVIEITTGHDRRSSTDDLIVLNIGPHKWELQKPQYDDFEKGKTDSYELDVPEGMDSSWFRFFCLDKKAHGKDDDWNLVKLVVKINDKIVYEKSDLDAWLNQLKPSWCAPEFNYGKAGE